MFTYLFWVWVSPPSLKDENGSRSEALWEYPSQPRLYAYRSVNISPTATKMHHPSQFIGLKKKKKNSMGFWNIFLSLTVFIFIYLFYLAALRGMWDLSSLTRDPTGAPCIGSGKSEPLDCQGSPWVSDRMEYLNSHVCTAHKSRPLQFCNPQKLLLPTKKYLP